VVAAGVRAFYLFSSQRTGPALDHELGAIGENHRWGVFFRPHFGDRTAYAFGARVDAGPKLGPIRLAFGAGASFLLMPDTADAIDLIIFHVQVVGAVWRWKHLVVQADAFTLDVNLVPANTDLDRSIDVRMGFSSGLTVGASF
jgi:hypothetical protein